MMKNDAPWVASAACSSVGTEVFFPEPGEEWKTTATLCRTRCPVVALCLDYAMRLEQGTDRNRRFGVWGGMTPGARHKHEPTWLAEQEVAA